MSKQNLYLGKTGEEAAVGFLRDNGYKILVRNYKTKLGEIDIVAKDKDTLAFIEVKTRKSDRFGAPLESVIKFKQRQISKATLAFLKENNLLDKKARFDVVSITYSNGAPKFDLIKDAFELDDTFTY
jgi:putative endonuclease